MEDEIINGEPKRYSDFRPWSLSLILIGSFNLLRQKRADDTNFFRSRQPAEATQTYMEKVHTQRISFGIACNS